MTLEELKKKIEYERDHLRERAELDANAGRDEDACAHDTAADYLDKVSRWVKEVAK